MSRFLVPLIVFAILIPIFIIGLGKDPSRLPSPFINKPAPQFELPSLTDAAKTVGSPDFANKMVLLNVWATWCVGCRQEHGFLMQLSRSGEIPLFGLNWRDNRVEAQRFLQQLGDPFVDSAFDQDGRVGIDWGVYGAPETFLIGADGTVLFKQLGPLSPAIWEENFVPLIEAARDNR